jgi:hypothetical protein
MLPILRLDLQEDKRYRIGMLTIPPQLLTQEETEILLDLGMIRPKGEDYEVVEPESVPAVKANKVAAFQMPLPRAG